MVIGMVGGVRIQFCFKEVLFSWERMVYKLWFCFEGLQCFMYWVGDRIVSEGRDFRCGLIMEIQGNEIVVMEIGVWLMKSRGYEDWGQGKGQYGQGQRIQIQEVQVVGIRIL